MALIIIVTVVESPPCVWGVHYDEIVKEVKDRITPMCMGSTRICNAVQRICQNHPHVYGEYVVTAMGEITLAESPPCVWGVPKSSLNSPRRFGITPMCMGSTLLNVARRN